MDLNDAILIFSSGLAAGAVLGHYIGRFDRKLEYDRGFMAGVDLVWPHLVAQWTRDLLSKHSKPPPDAPTGGQTRPKDSV